MNTHRFHSFLVGLLLGAISSSLSFGAFPVSSSSESTMPTEESLGIPFASVGIPDRLDDAAAMNACVKTATGRKWKIVAKEGNMLETNLKHRSWDATVYYVIKDGSIWMYSDSYEVNKKTGERKKKADPKGWLKNLVKDVTVFMDRAAYGE